MKTRVTIALTGVPALAVLRAADLYRVAAIFFPWDLPVPVEERAVCFEVSAVIIAFVPLGKYMEEKAALYRMSLAAAE